jgi:hypothetical protein
MPSLLDVYESESLNWVFFDSSALNAAAYIPAERLLYLEFHGGERYRYFDFHPSNIRTSWRPNPKAHTSGNISVIFSCSNALRIPAALVASSPDF